MTIGYTKSGKTPHLVNFFIDSTKTLCGRDVVVTEHWLKRQPLLSICPTCLKRGSHGL